MNSQQIQFLTGQRPAVVVAGGYHPKLIAALAAASLLAWQSPAAAYPVYWPNQTFEQADSPPRAPAPRKRVVRRGSPKLAAAPKETEKPIGPLIIAISIEKQHLRVFDANGLFAEAPVSTGMRGHSTPMGVFSIIQKSKWHRSNIYSGAPMPYMQRITWSGVALHAGVLPGYPASHGCIRMPIAFATRLWGWSKLGARVVIAPGDVTPAEISHPALIARAADLPAAAALSPDKPADVAKADVSKTDSTRSDKVTVANATSKPAPGLDALELRLTSQHEELKLAQPPSTARSDASDRIRIADADGGATPPVRSDTSAAGPELKPDAAAATEPAATETSQDKPAAAAVATRAEASAVKAAPEQTAGAPPADAAKDQSRTPETARDVVAKDVVAKDVAAQNLAANDGPSKDMSSKDMTSNDSPAKALSSTVSVPKEPAPNDGPLKEATSTGAASTDTPARDVVSKDAAPKADALQAETLKAETPRIETPKTETPKIEAPKAEAPSVVAPKRTGHLAVLISRKENRMYVRQNFEPLFDVPVTIAQSDRPLGTHVFTARADAGDPTTYRWSVVSLPTLPKRSDARAEDLGSRRKRSVTVVEPPAPTPPATPAEALDRLTIPKDAMARIAAALATGASIVVSDQGLGGETGLGTDFIVGLR